MVVIEKQQHPESAVGCQSQATMGFFRYRQIQLFCPPAARLNIITSRGENTATIVAVSDGAVQVKNSRYPGRGVRVKKGYRTIVLSGRLFPGERR
jgi:hypothetical protein